jgi:hypothetical protein
MKTYWDYLPGFILVAILPFIVGALPTVQVFNRMLGGGPIRQFAINWVGRYLPSEPRSQLVDAFMSASKLGEYLLFLPIALNIALVLMWLVAITAAINVHFQNWFIANKYQSTRKAAK